MFKRDIVVIGASAGGVVALRDLVASFPKDFPAAIFVVLHLSPHSPSYLPEILSREGNLKAVHPKDGESIQAGRIYLAPPDHHLLVEEGRVLVKKGPKENRFRPSVDALFRSAAYSYGSRVIGVVMTGMLNDGTSGMWSIKRRGGLTIIQDPQDAEYPSMPNSVLEYVDVDYRVPVAEMGPLLNELTSQPAPEAKPLTAYEQDRMEMEVRIAAQKNAFEMGIHQLGERSLLTCPECHGALAELKEGKLIRYRCHTGHSYTASTLLSEVTAAVEESIWNVIRGLEETVMLLEQMVDSLNQGGHAEEAEKFRAEAERNRKRARDLHHFAFSQPILSEDLGLTSLRDA